jgi:hypothetical protein
MEQLNATATRPTCTEMTDMGGICSTNICQFNT